MTSTSKEYLKFEKNNIDSLSKLKKRQKHNFEPTYYQVIAENIKNDKQNKRYFNELIKHIKTYKKI